MFQRELNALEARKQLLIAESEVNRVLLVRDYQALADCAREASQPLKNLGLLASSATPLLALLKILPSGNHNGNGHSSERSRSGFFSPMNLIRLALGIWSGFRREED